MKSCRLFTWRIEYLSSLPKSRLHSFGTAHMQISNFPNSKRSRNVMLGKWRCRSGQQVKIKTKAGQWIEHTTEKKNGNRDSHWKVTTFNLAEVSRAAIFFIFFLHVRAEREVNDSQDRSLLFQHVDRYCSVCLLSFTQAHAQAGSSVSMRAHFSVPYFDQRETRAQPSEQTKTGERRDKRCIIKIQSEMKSSYFSPIMYACYLWLDVDKKKSARAKIQIAQIPGRLFFHLSRAMKT